MSLTAIARYVPIAKQRGVSTVARSPRGFLTAYRKAGGKKSKLSIYWRRRRAAFIARHMAHVRKRGESLKKNGKPTRRALALMMWAYQPRS